MDEKQPKSAEKKAQNQNIERESEKEKRDFVANRIHPYIILNY